MKEKESSFAGGGVSMGWNKLREHLTELKESLVIFRDTLKEVKITLIDVAGILSLITLLYKYLAG
jgi:hypothetical protein